ncbi:MAG TPA: hypothetical protein VNN07_01585 [Candidatus Tectomicrobia bacterium]|nr:hypothetical protein [Candidatus Tectomicrobia bacterium]
MSTVLARLSLVTVLLTAGCVSAPPLATVLDASPPGPLLRFGVDTLAFRNESRSKNRGKPDLYANWCFVMARAITQFQRFARFDPAAPRLTADEYTARVREITGRAPWRDPLPADDRIVIPGYASLHEFSRAEEAAVKAGMGGRFLSWIHWTNWRVAFPMPAAQQEGVARETLAELQAGRLVQWLVTNLPRIELNHTVVVYDYRPGPGWVDFVVYDPNDPAEPGIIRYDEGERRFWSTRLHDTEVGPMRAFRMYYSAWL